MNSICSSELLFKRPPYEYIFNSKRVLLSTKKTWSRPDSNRYAAISFFVLFARLDRFLANLPIFLIKVCRNEAGSLPDETHARNRKYPASVRRKIELDSARTSPDINVKTLASLKTFSVFR